MTFVVWDCKTQRVFTSLDHECHSTAVAAQQRGFAEVMSWMNYWSASSISGLLLWQSARQRPMFWCILWYNNTTKKSTSCISFSLQHDAWAMKWHRTWWSCYLALKLPCVAGHSSLLTPPPPVHRKRSPSPSPGSTLRPPKPAGLCQCPQVGCCRAHKWTGDHIYWSSEPLPTKISDKPEQNSIQMLQEVKDYPEWIRTVFGNSDWGGKSQLNKWRWKVRWLDKEIGKCCRDESHFVCDPRSDSEPTLHRNGKICVGIEKCSDKCCLLILYRKRCNFSLVN